MIHISKVTGHEIQWLYTGEGRKIISQASDQHVSREESRLLMLYREADEETKKEIVYRLAKG